MPQNPASEMIFESLEPVTFPFKIKDAKTNSFIQYYLREATEDAAVKYRNAAMRAARFTDGKLSSVEGVADVEPLLVSLCLYQITPKGDVPVQLATIRGWPARIVKPLFEKAKQLSNLDEGEDEAGIQKQIEDLSERLAKMREDKNKEKNLLEGMTGISEGVKD